MTGLIEILLKLSTDNARMRQSLFGSGTVLLAPKFEGMSPNDMNILEFSQYTDKDGMAKFKMLTRYVIQPSRFAFGCVANRKEYLTNRHITLRHLESAIL